MNLPSANIFIKQTFKQWLRSRLAGAYQNDTPFWRRVSAGLWLMASFIVGIAALGVPTGFGSFFDVTAGIGLNTVALAVSGSIVTYVLALIGLKLPRFFAGSLIFVGLEIYEILYFADLGMTMSIVFSCCFTIAGAILGLLLGWLCSPRTKAEVKIVLTSALILSGGFILAIALTSDAAKETPDAAAVAGVIESVPTLNAASPAQPGEYAYQYFTYGSGEDLHRTEYGKNAALITGSVDASAYIHKWSWLRGKFWGFDETALPVNGRVWMPKGDGTYPLVLMVHGNHLMEQYSDGGYAYLGELLASRGFIAVSVDENFLNYSVWSGIPDNDMKVRAWMLLKHLQQVMIFNEQPGNAFFNHVDFSQVAMLGHSRGGQAVAMAADGERWFVKDQGLKDFGGFKIKAVIALAPTDKSVDYASAFLKDVDYLTLQGAQDGDVNNFYGDRQYVRTSLSANSDNFKASLYIANANHSQFNTDWGSMDDSLPAGLFLNHEQIMEASDQREIAKIYVSAFLETALHRQQEYLGLFRDYRTGLDWLPDSTYFNRYEDGAFLKVASFDEDTNKKTAKGGGTIDTAGFKVWREEEAEDRDRNAKGTDGVVLEWQTGGAYSINISESFSNILKDANITAFQFSMADLQRDLLKAGVTRSITLPKLEIEFESAEGVQVRLPLAQFMNVEALPYTTYTKIPWLEKRINDGKYEEHVEPVFQTYMVPLHAFQEADPKFKPASIQRITIHCVDGPGKIMLDDLGFSSDTHVL